MKILLIVGSETNSNSAYIANQIIKKFSDIDMKILNLSNISMQFCNGCLSCDETGKCTLLDDMSSIVESVSDYDGYIFISPVRWSLLSGYMKTFFDRLNPLATTAKLAGKKSISIVIGQSKCNELGAESVNLASKSIQFFCENAEIEVVDSVEIFNCLMHGDIENSHDDLSRCISSVQKLITSLN